MKNKFERDFEGGTIRLPAKLDGEGNLFMLFDTGASCTSFDKNILLMANYELNNPVKTVLNETANGIIETEIFLIKTFSALGITKQNVEVQVFDYIQHDIRSNYQGVLGLDFFEGTCFAVDMVDNTITVEQL